MMRDLRGDQLPAWMERVNADDLPSLHSLINGLSRDIGAVTAGLSTPWSSGQVEGQATRTKQVKRQGYGRAGASTSSASASSSRPDPTASQDQLQIRITRSSTVINQPRSDAC